jgi:type IV secretion system protein VirB3
VASLEQSFDVPLHASLHRPLLIFGGERELVLMYAVTVFTFIFAVLTWWATALGVALWMTGQWGLARAAVFDPQLSRTGLRALRYRKAYRAYATPFARLKEWK